MAIAERLSSLLGPSGWLPAEAVADWRIPPWPQLKPRAALGVARPASLEETCALLRVCAEAGQAVVPAGGQSGLVHGADSEPDQVVLSLERMHAIRDVDPAGRTLIAEAGATIQSVQEAAEAHGLVYPVDWGARGSATVGGSLATNAGGNRVLRYGMTRDRVLGVEAALMDGTAVHGLSRLIKNNTGYDLKNLLIGSEGTLAVLTAAALRLSEKPLSQNAALARAPTLAAVAALLRHADRALPLSAFEVLWPEAYEVLSKGAGAAPLPSGPGYTVLIEAMGGHPASDAAAFEAALDGALAQGLIADAVLAKSDAEIAAFWRIRESVLHFAAFWPLIAFDVSLPIGAMEAYVAGLREGLSARFAAAKLFVFGHLGDGNLHLVVAPGADDAETRAAAERLVYEPLRAVGGSISAEHGIGLEKRGWLSVSRSPAEIALMRTVKQAFDPKGLLNPGRVLPPV